MKVPISQNNEGAAYLRAGSYTAAIASFSGSMRMLRRFYREHVNTDSAADNESIGQNPTILPRINSSVDDPDAVSEAGDTIFDQAVGLLIRPDFTTATLNDVNLLTITTLLFNLGLAYHLRATLDSGSSRFEDIRQAKSIYKVGIKAFFVMARASPEDLDPSIYPLLAVLSNNLGCIAIEEYDYDTVDHCVALTEVEDIPMELPFIQLNKQSWCNFRAKPSPAA